MRLSLASSHLILLLFQINAVLSVTECILFFVSFCRDYLGARHSNSSSQAESQGMQSLLLLRKIHDRPTPPFDEDIHRLVERGVRKEDVVCGLEEVVRRVREVNGG